MAGRKRETVREPTKRPPGRPRAGDKVAAKTIIFRVTEDEKDAVEKAANKKKETITQFAKGATLGAARSVLLNK